MANAPHPPSDAALESGSARDELLVDQAINESFPASDPPFWTPTHAGAPIPVHRIETPRELRGHLRSDVDAFAGGKSTDFFAEQLLAVDRAVTRIPIRTGRSEETIETMVRGVERGAEVVVSARVDDPAAAAVLLGLARILNGRKFAHTVRLVAFPPGDASREGSLSYVKRLRRQGVELKAALSLERVSFGSVLDRSAVLFVGNRSARGLLGAVRGSFRAGAELPSKTLSLPAIVPVARAGAHRSFWDVGYPAILVAGAVPLFSPKAAKRKRVDHDFDAMADLTFGLAAVIAQLAAARPS